ncbi:hypothetical protein TEA_027110 [Camellia sinensis var. sinensis]|uniref:F-box domain-containing protein n=1 Tax=Camellia sinensis var. sinensis TaxID=542762 RepID=A0A4S4DZ62_CAMSN|nr:hypothetical protein TEA_027110 [Camellia sinensis var. sinensis]
MGAILSCRARNCELYEISQGEACKRQRTSSSFYEENPRLIPSLPDEISIQILARLPRICHLGVKSVSRSWKAAIVSPELYKVRKELGTTEEWLYVLTKVEDDKLMWYALDPLSRKWQRLPPMPNLNGEEGYVPIRDFTDSESPYLLGGFLGKLHVITKDANHNIAVMQAERHNDSSSLPSTSSTPLDESSNSAGSESNVWKVIATRRAGSEELINCQILDI